MKLKPTRHYLLVRMHNVEKSNIVLPETAKSTGMSFGEVLAIGSEVKNTKIGDKVLFSLDSVIGFEHAAFKNQFIVPEGSVFAMLDLENVVPMS